MSSSPPTYRELSHYVSLFIFPMCDVVRPGQHSSMPTCTPPPSPPPPSPAPTAGTAPRSAPTPPAWCPAKRKESRLGSQNVWLPKVLSPTADSDVVSHVPPIVIQHQRHHHYDHRNIIQNYIRRHSGKYLAKYCSIMAKWWMRDHVQGVDIEKY